jgi:magnesium transporter
MTENINTVSEKSILEIMNEEHISSAELLALLEEMNEVDIAGAFEALDEEKVIQLFNLLPKDIETDVFSYISPEKQRIIAEKMSDAEVGQIVDDLFVDDAVDFVDEMPDELVERVLQNVDEEKREIINQFLQYPDNSVGSIMTTEYVYLEENTTVKEAFDIIRAKGLDKETIYTCYVIRRNELHRKILIGVVSAKALMLSDPNEHIVDIMDENVICAHANDKKEEIAVVFRKYELLALPVVDEERRLVGIVTIDDIVQVIEEENTEDIEIMAALNPSETTYMKTGIFMQSRNRIMWLMFLMLSATITGAIITSFEESLAVLPILVAFIPMLMGTGGNAGSQSAVLIVRGIALDEIRFNDIFKVLWIEIRVALLCGLALSLVNFIRVYLMNGQDLLLCATVSLSLIATVVVAKSVGCILPLLAKKIKIDPAIMATPLISTIADAASLIVYFSIARMILKI